MNSKRLIPVGREIRFIGVSVLVLLAGIGLGLTVILMAFSQQLSSDFAEAHRALFRLNQHATVVFLVAVLLQTAISLLLIYMLALRYSHRISGPMYRVRMVLTDYLHGRSAQSVRFRSGDFLLPVAEALSGLLAQQEADDQTIQELMHLMTSGSISEFEHRLPEIRHLVERLNREGPDHE